MTMKEKRFSFFAYPQERKAESRPTFGTLPFARHTSQRFAKVKEPNLSTLLFIDFQNIIIIWSNFNNILSGSDTDVQLALDTLDNHSHSALYQPLNTKLTNLSGLSNEDGYVVIYCEN